MKNQIRNLHPIPEAVFAMCHWHDEYAKQGGGSMDFYDALNASDRRYCRDVVKKIFISAESHNYPLNK